MHLLAKKHWTTVILLVVRVPVLSEQILNHAPTSKKHWATVILLVVRVPVLSEQILKHAPTSQEALDDSHPVGCEGTSLVWADSKACTYQPRSIGRQSSCWLWGYQSCLSRFYSMHLPAKKHWTTVILLVVRLPVLSEQILKHAPTSQEALDDSHHVGCGGTSLVWVDSKACTYQPRSIGRQSSCWLWGYQSCLSRF